MSSAMSSDEIKSATAHEVNNSLTKLISLNSVRPFYIG